MNTLELQKQIDNKNQELLLLQSDILALSQIQVQEKVHLEQKKLQLQEELKVLQEQLEELKILETTHQVDQTQEETDKLKNTISVEKYSTNEIIKESIMYKKLLEIGKTPEEIEVFGNTIDTTVKKYLDQELVGISDEVKNNMGVGIQFAMMDALMKDGKNGADFFENFSKTKTNDGKNVLTGLFSAFSTSDIFFQLANKVQNISKYISLNKNKLINQTNIPELSNPYKFMKLLQNDIWKNMDALYTLDISTVLTLDSTVGVILSDDEKTLMWNIANNDVMNTVITEKSVSAIEKSITTANNGLDKRAGFKDSASSIFETIFGKFDIISDINIPLVGNIGDLIGFTWPIDMLGGAMDNIGADGKKKKSILNFILTGLGFSGGLPGLHKSYVMEGLDKLLVDSNKNFISTSYKTYIDTADISITNDSSGSTGKKLETIITETDPTKKQAILDKIPADYTTLKSSLVDALSNDVVLSKSIVKEFYTDEIIYRDDGSVDISLISDKNDFIEKYLQFILPKLTNSGDKFINSCPDANSFLVSVAGFLVGGKYFQEAVNLGLVRKEDYGEYTNYIPSQDSENLNYTGSISRDLTRTGLTHCKLSTIEYTAFAQKVIDISQNIDINPEYLMKVIAFESAGTFDPSIKNGASSGATGLIQFMPKTAIGLGTNTAALSKMTAIEQLTYVEKYFSPYTGKLKTLEDVYLAVFTPAFIGKPLDYIAYERGTSGYWQNKGFDTNSDGKMTVGEITATIRNTTKNLTFYDIPIQQREIYTGNSEILAKLFNQLSIVGDSHAGGIKTMGGLSDEQKKRVHYENGFDTARLLDKIKKEKASILPTGTKSLILLAGANNISNGTVSKIKEHLQAIKDEIAPVQLVLQTLQYYPDKTMVSDIQVDEVNTIIRSFTQENNLPVIDINKNVTLVSADYQTDNRHLTANGYTKIVKEITQEVMGDNIA